MEFKPRLFDSMASYSHYGQDYLLYMALRPCTLVPTWLSILTACQFPFLEHVMQPSILGSLLFLLDGMYFSTALSIMNLCNYPSDLRSLREVPLTPWNRSGTTNRILIATSISPSQNILQFAATHLCL